MDLNREVIMTKQNENEPKKTKVITSLRNIKAFLHEDILDELGWSEVDGEISVLGLEPKALSSYDEKIDKYERRARYLIFYRGLASLEQGNPEDALYGFKYLLESDMVYRSSTSRLDFNFFLGLAYMGIGDIEKSIYHLEEYSGCKDDVNYWLGIAYYRLLDFNTAKKYLDLAIRHDPEFEEARILRLKVHYGLGNLSDFEEDFSKMLELNPENTEAQYYLSLVKDIHEKYKQLLENIDDEEDEV
jgi:tetratricopeptide (TPR) repeat protein